MVSSSTVPARVAATPACHEMEYATVRYTQELSTVAAISAPSWKASEARCASVATAFDSPPTDCCR